MRRAVWEPGSAGKDAGAPRSPVDALDVARGGHLTFDAPFGAALQFYPSVFRTVVGCPDVPVVLGRDGELNFLGAASHLDGTSMLSTMDWKRGVVDLTITTWPCEMNQVLVLVGMPTPSGSSWVGV